MHFNQNEAREMIMEHYKNPVNKKDLDDKFQTHYSNTCSDKVQLDIQWENDKIKEANFNGIGCAIFVASTDMFLSLIKNKTKEEVSNLISLFEKFVNQEQLSHEQITKLENLWVFYNVKSHLNRVNCALLITKAYQDENNS
ncbi:SUF system NifU family Fe-S cluster assembly protein [Mycoplasma sp. 2704]|uniref:Fe-S cluster assembly sulfur transfer protein SufU n=1 Tax=Mycoplasma sp. 2704 TaxID=3108529 RepID=UPI002B1DE023|nr:SUF system NifU family Fe-S cluster assembly protein [Mycoplasma sp. 2704]MEA4134386.1 SUF system NifU family Fe-S cluster assembly protein [Mycoplasma sp. 2704]